MFRQYNMFGKIVILVRFKMKDCKISDSGRGRSRRRSNGRDECRSISCGSKDRVICLTFSGFTEIYQDLLNRCNEKESCEVCNEVPDSVSCSCIKKDEECATPTIPIAQPVTSSILTTTRKQVTTRTTTSTSTLSPSPTVTTPSRTSRFTALTTKTTDRATTTLTSVFIGSTRFLSSVSPSEEALGMKKKQSIGPGAIVGITFGLLALLALLIILFLFMRRRKRMLLMKQKSGGEPHYFTVEEEPYNQYEEQPVTQYEEIPDIVEKTSTIIDSDYNHLGEPVIMEADNSESYNHLPHQTLQNANDYNEIKHFPEDMGNNSCIVNNNYSHITNVSKENPSDDYNHLHVHSKNETSSAISSDYHHIRLENQVESFDNSVKDN